MQLQILALLHVALTVRATEDCDTDKVALQSPQNVQKNPLTALHEAKVVLPSSLELVTKTLPLPSQIPELNVKKTVSDILDIPPYYSDLFDSQTEKPTYIHQVLLASVTTYAAAVTFTSLTVPTPIDPVIVHPQGSIVSEVRTTATTIEHSTSVEETDSFPQVLLASVTAAPATSTPSLGSSTIDDLTSTAESMSSSTPTNIASTNLGDMPATTNLAASTVLMDGPSMSSATIGVAVDTTPFQDAYVDSVVYFTPITTTKVPQLGDSTLSTQTTETAIPPAILLVSHALAPPLLASGSEPCDDSLLMVRWNETMLPPPLYMNRTSCPSRPFTNSSSSTSAFLTSTATRAAATLQTTRAATTLVISHSSAGQMQPFLCTASCLLALLLLHIH